MFPQDARDVMMSAPKEMENRISWTTDQEEAIQAALEVLSFINGIVIYSHSILVPLLLTPKLQACGPAK